MSVIDETSGPGKPVGLPLFAESLREIWEALGHDDGRVPTLDEVLIEIRELVDDENIPDTRHGEPVHLRPGPSVTWGAFGMTVLGYSADDAIRLRQAYMQEKQS